MKAMGKKRNIIYFFISVAGLSLFLLVGGIYFKGYLDQQIFIERATQLNEITAQVRENLNNALDSHWNYLEAAVNLLEGWDEPGSEDDVTDYIDDLEEILEMDHYNSMLMLLDSQGNCYDDSGRHGVWTDIDQISGGEDRYAFISRTDIYENSHWAFVEKFQQPLRIKDSDISFTHAVLLKDIYTLTQYYDSGAYSSKNETYILKSNGTRMHDDITSNKTIQAYNVLKVLEDMEGQKIPDIKAAMEETNIISTNFWYEGMEYYYCLTSLEKYDTLLLFLIPAEYVASGTVDMVGAVVRMVLFLAAFLIVLLILVIVSVTRQQSSIRLFRQEQENLHRQEQMNVQLEESNAMLARSKETAEQAFQIAEEANRAKSSFLSNMSHDIRTPMNAIVGFATLLTKDAEDPDKVREYTKKITASSQHLLGLINDILDISKIEAGKTTLNLSDENIVDLMEGIDVIIRPQMKAKNHTFEVRNQGLKHEQVIMDKIRLNQILLNLLSNAVKYTQEGGHITFTVQELPQYTNQLARFQFIVSDNGYGMSKEYQKKIFQAFTREEDSVTNKIQGTGLGMSITKSLLDLMGGTITVESEKDKGSTFTVNLDLHVSEHEIDQDYWRKNGITRMLVVDDEEVICQNIQLTMEETGVTVDYVLNGKSAIEMVKQSETDKTPYQVVLLDWKMPGLSGVETAKCIRKETTSKVPVLVLTSYDWLEIEEEAREAGVDAFISKPFFLTSFRQKVEGILSRDLQAGGSLQDAEGDLHNMHILAAEDNEINAEILQELLGMEGAFCDICENGQLVVEAFEKSEPGQYQLILMDVQMPVMNGYEATKAIRASNHSMAGTIPVIAMTANAFADDIRDALESGMNAHIAKPIDMTVLKQTVKGVMEAQKDKEENI